MSVVAVLRPSYYLVIDLQSKAAIAASPLVVVFPIAPFDPVMHCGAFPN